MMRLVFAAQEKVLLCPRPRHVVLLQGPGIGARQKAELEGLFLLFGTPSALLYMSLHRSDFRLRLNSAVKSTGFVVHFVYVVWQVYF